uniref:Nonsense-mediated mRNA decay factor SMG9 n=1 Tax=Oncorhynchus mykiss TaxID=8022 RepID=A0A8C7RV78_ONCMY
MSESGHSQPGMYGQGRRRRQRRDRDVGPPGQNLSGPSRDQEYVPRERRDASEELPGPLLQKTPIILAKPLGVRSKPSKSVPISGGQALEKPIMLIKTREDGGKPGTPPDVASPPLCLLLVGLQVIMFIANSLPDNMDHAWTMPVLQYLRYQTDMVVVGVIGLQGTGKSTIMSLLSANAPEEDQKGYVFRAQIQEIKERGGNQSTGIDFYITQERVIFLDTQPILSPSILDRLINNECKLPPEYNLPHTYVEMQITAVLFTVCHVVILIQYWFTDINIYRFLQTAEMLKPSTPSASHDSTGSSVFLQNKSSRDEFCPRNLKNMHMAVDKLMAHSHLKYKGTLSMLDCNIFPGLDRDYLETEVNMFLLPLMENEGEDALTKAGSGAAPLFSLLPLFHYAVRIWGGVKKSSALSEYSCLPA